jgi:hypothetical protein
MTGAMMRTLLRVLLAGLGVSAVLIALSILTLGAGATAAAGERVFDALSGWRGPASPPWPPTMDNELRVLCRPVGRLWRSAPACGAGLQAADRMLLPTRRLHDGGDRCPLGLSERARTANCLVPPRGSNRGNVRRLRWTSCAALGGRNFGLCGDFAVRHLRILFGCDGTRRRHHRSPAVAASPAGQDSGWGQPALISARHSDAPFAAEVHSFLRRRLSANRPAKRERVDGATIELRIRTSRPQFDNDRRKITKSLPPIRRCPKWVMHKSPAPRSPKSG